MKGIFKKLFLGLFFCALICAGFSKNVKAAATVSDIKVGYDLTTGVSIDVKMSAATGETSDVFTLKMGYSNNNSEAPTAIGTVDWNGNQWVFNPISPGAGDGYNFSSASSSSTDTLTIVPASGDEVKQKEMIRSAAKDKLDDKKTSGTIYVNVFDGTKTYNKNVKVFNSIVTVTVSGTSGIYEDKSNLVATKDDFEADIITSPGADNRWGFSGEKFVYELKGKDPLGASYLNSTHKKINTSVGTTSTHESNQWEVEFNETYSGATVGYEYVGVDKLEFVHGTSSALLPIEGANIYYKGESDSRRVKLTGIKNVDGGDPWASYSEIKLSTSGTAYSVSPTSLNPTTEFRITPSKVKIGNKLIVIAYDSAISTEDPIYKWQYSFNTVDEPTITFKPTTYFVGVGETKDTSVFIGDEDITGYCDFDTDKATIAEIDSSGEISGVSKGSTKIKAVYEWSSDYEGTTGEEPPVKTTATVIVGSGSTGGSLRFSSDPVCVSEGCEVNLVDFMSASDKTMYVNLRLEGGIAKLGSKITTPEELKNVKIKGTKAGKKTGGITVWSFDDEDNPVMADLKVYPSPSISTGSSGGFGSFNSSSSSSNAGITVSVPASTYHGGESDWVPSVKYAFVTFNSLSSGKSTTLRGSVSGTTSSDSKTATVSLATVSNEISKIAKGDNDQIYVEVNPESAESDMLPDKAVSGVGILNAFKIELKGDSATYKVNGESVKDYFYAIADQEYTIESVAKNSGDKFQKWEGDESSTAKIDKIKFSSPRTLHAVYGNSSSSSSSSSSSKLTANGTGTGADSEGLDDVPKTGESKTDIWILWTVLLVSILGAGFMIYRRFGVVNAIAQAQADETAAIEQEKIDAEVKEKEDKLRVLKNLRNLK